MSNSDSDAASGSVSGLRAKWSDLRGRFTRAFKRYVPIFIFAFLAVCIPGQLVINYIHGPPSVDLPLQEGNGTIVVVSRYTYAATQFYKLGSEMTKYFDPNALYVTAALVALFLLYGAIMLLSIVLQGIRSAFDLITQPQNLVIWLVSVAMSGSFLIIHDAYSNGLSWTNAVLCFLEFLIVITYDARYLWALALSVLTVCLGISAHLKSQYLKPYVLMNVKANPMHFPKSLWSSLTVRERIRTLNDYFRKHNVITNGRITIRKSEGFVLNSPVPVARKTDKARSGCIGIVDDSDNSFDHVGFVTRVDYYNKTRGHCWVTTAWHVVERLVTIHQSENKKIVIYANCGAYIDVTAHVIDEYNKKSNLMSNKRHNDAAVLSIPSVLVDRAGLMKVKLSHSILQAKVRLHMLLLDPIEHVTMHVKGEVVDTDGMVFHHNLNTEPGYSGAAVLIEVGTAYFFVGIHCGQRFKNGVPACNYGADYSRMLQIIRVPHTAAVETDVRQDNHYFQWKNRQTDDEWAAMYDSSRSAEYADLGDNAVEVRFDKKNARFYANQTDFSLAIDIDVDDYDSEGERAIDRLVDDENENPYADIARDDVGYISESFKKTTETMREDFRTALADYSAHIAREFARLLPVAPAATSEPLDLKALAVLVAGEIRPILSESAPPLELRPESLDNTVNTAVATAVSSLAKDTEHSVANMMLQVRREVHESDVRTEKRLTEIKQLMEAFNKNLRQSSNPKAKASAGK